MPYESGLAALSDPTRQTILARIIAQPLSVNEIAQDLPISRPAVSQHLRVLREADLVREEREGTKRIYHAQSQALGELRAYVDAMWRASLGAFAEAAAAEGGTGGSDE
jgi:DNA-binding transcriptional ArsR family regulator